MIAFTAVLLMNFGQTVGGYVTFAEQRGHVVGSWAQNQPTQYDPRSDEFTFHMIDESGTRRRVVYHGPKPGNFEEAEQLVVEGQMQDGVFVAKHILVKCPSKYNDQA